MKITNGFFVLYLSFGLILFACGGGSGGGGVTGTGGGGLGSGGGNGGGDDGGGDGGGTATSISTSRLSVSSGGTQGNSISSAPSISSDGRYVVFESVADNLVDGDTNGVKDIFVHDRDTGTTGRVSVSSGGTQGNSISSAPSISSDGRYVVFESVADNLVDGDTNGVKDIFVHDRETGTTSRVSVSSSGTQGNSTSSAPSISSDGRYVVFESVATNLVDGDTNGVKDIFVHDRETGTTSRVSVSSSGAQGNSISSAPSISSDGRYVVFESVATNLAPGDTNGVSDVFIHDRNTEVTGMASIAADGTQGNGTSSAPSISSDGRYIAFESSAANLASGDTNGVKDIFIHDSIEGITTRVSVDSSGIQGNSINSAPSISSDGRYVVFESLANNLVAGDTRGLQDIFVHDRDSDGNSVFDETGIGQTAAIRVSVDSDGNEAAGGNSAAPSISSDGKHVAFESIAANLVTDDTNGLNDIFVNGP